MNIPTLPTDNLYKFMAITGVAVILTATLFMTSRIEEIYEKVFDLSKNISLLEESIKISESETEALSKTIATLTKKLTKKVKTEEHALLLIYSDTAIKKLIEDQRANSLPLRSDLVRLRADHDRIKHYSDRILQYYFFLLIINIVGVWMSYLGFRLWYARVQKPLDLLIQKQTKNTTTHPFARKNYSENGKK